MRSAPKPSRVVDPKFSEKVLKRDGVCVAGLFLRDLCTGPLDPHHIDSKGSGGDDTVENGVTLCRKHHNLAQEYKIKKHTLRKWLQRLYGYEYPS